MEVLVVLIVELEFGVLVAVTVLVVVVVGGGGTIVVDVSGTTGQLDEGLSVSGSDILA